MEMGGCSRIRIWKKDGQFDAYNLSPATKSQGGFKSNSLMITMDKTYF